MPGRRPADETDRPPAKADEENGGAAADAGRSLAPPAIRNRQTNLRRAIKLLEKLVAEHPNAPDYRHLLACCYRDLPSGEPEAPGQPGSESREKAVAILEKLADDFPKVPEYRYDLSKAYAKVDPNDPWLRDNYAAAETRLRQSLKILDRLAAEYPNAPDYSASQVHSLYLLSEVLRSRGADDGEATLKTALAQAVVPGRPVSSSQCLPGVEGDHPGVVGQVAGRPWPGERCARVVGIGDRHAGATPERRTASRLRPRSNGTLLQQSGRGAYVSGRGTASCGNPAAREILQRAQMSLRLRLTSAGPSRHPRRRTVLRSVDRRRSDHYHGEPGNRRTRVSPLVSSSVALGPWAITSPVNNSQMAPGRPASISRGPLRAACNTR